MRQRSRAVVRPRNPRSIHSRMSMHTTISFALGLLTWISVATLSLQAVAANAVAATEADEETIASRLQRFESATKNGDTRLAELLATQLISSDPKNPAHYVRRAVFYAGEDQWEKAIEDYSSAIVLDPKNHNLYVSRFLLNIDNSTLSYSRWLPMAKADLKLAIELDPTNSTNRFLSAKVKINIAVGMKSRLTEISEVFRIQSLIDLAISFWPTDDSLKIQKLAVLDQNPITGYEELLKVLDSINENQYKQRISIVRKHVIEQQAFAKASASAVSSFVARQAPPASPYMAAGIHRDNRFQVLKVTDSPARSIAYVKSREGGHCTGVFALDNRVVVFAAHCIEASQSKVFTISILDADGNTLESIPATVFAMGDLSGKEGVATDVTSARLWAQQNNGSDFGRRTRRQEDWAVLKLERAPRVDVEPLGFVDAQSSMFRIPQNDLRFLGLGFPGDIFFADQKARLIGVDCSVTGVSPIVVYKRSFGLDLSTGPGGDGCVTYGGMSGGPLLFYEPVVGRWRIVGLLAVSIPRFWFATEDGRPADSKESAIVLFKPRELLEKVKIIRATQPSRGPALTHERNLEVLRSDLRRYDGGLLQNNFGAIETFWVLTPELVQNSYLASGMEYKASVDDGPWNRCSKDRSRCYWQGVKRLPTLNSLP